MSEQAKIAKNLERFARAVASHDRENPTHTAWGIGLSHFDMERLSFEEGEEVLPGITIHGDSGVTGNFRRGRRRGRAGERRGRELAASASERA
jgi:hypothetical protein